MNVWDAVRTKRAIRKFADRPIAPADLDRIVRAGTRAHSSKNQQRWAFVVVRGSRAARGAVEGRPVRRARRRAPRRPWRS